LLSARPDIVASISFLYFNSWANNQKAERGKVLRWLDGSDHVIPNLVFNEEVFL